MTFAEFLALSTSLVDDELLRMMRKPHVPARLRSAMEYSLFSGGKRLRPAMVLFSARMFGDSPGSLAAAAAVEMIHTYSLIHDDLPAMDDDDLRRGRPSCHRAFDEATAILAGDALLTLAFEKVGNLTSNGVSAEIAIAAVLDLARAAGYQGMVAGQALDMSLDKSAGSPEIREMHELKTGRLFQTSVRLGGIISGCTAAEGDLLMRFGFHFGRLYQAVDDIEDSGRDTSDVERSSLAETMGHAGARKYAQQQATESLDCLTGFGDKAWWFQELVSHVLSKVTGH